MDIEIKSQPFTREELGKIKEGLSCGRIRRFAAIVDHQKLKYSYNALVAWHKQSLKPHLATRLKEKDYISHIYLRKNHRLWPFGLYTMIHARHKKKLDRYILEVSKFLGSSNFKVLETVREFKKASFNPAHFDNLLPSHYK